MADITILSPSNAPQGPFTREQVAQKLAAGEFTLESLAFVDGLAQWTPLRDVLAKVDGPLPPPIDVAPPLPATPAVYSYAATMAPPPHLVYAGFWLRVAAHVLDNLIVSIPFTAIWIVIVIMFVGVGAFSMASQANGGQPGQPSVMFIGTIVVAYLGLILGRFIAIWLYHAFLESGPHQSTWGKRALGLKVTSYTGQRITFGHASGRYFSTLITNMTMGVGYLMVAFTDRKQTLHDMMAGTLVVRQ